MHNPNQPGYNPTNHNHPAHLVGADALNESASENREDEDRVFERNLPEDAEGRSEADKEADARPEDFESFNVDKVDELEKTKEHYDSEEENA